MQIGIENFHSVYNKNNALFKPESYLIGENLGAPFILLKEKLRLTHNEINTLDILPLEKCDIIIFLDYSKEKVQDFLAKNKSLKSYLVIFESELIVENNWEKENHEFFTKIFTWHDEWIDGKKYIKYYWPNVIPDNFKLEFIEKQKLCTLIAGNKTNHDPRELYGKRIEAIHWFEKNHPEDFDFYGVGWEKGSFKPFFAFLTRSRLLEKGMNFLEKLSFFQKIFRKSFSSYKGKVKSKKETLQKYKFSICYENAKDIPGYITEKIFDCFLAGCVPVYWGAPNVTDFIPENTFIDKRQFKNYDDLYAFMKNMNEETYLEYLKNIELFLNSDQGKKFSAENFVETIIREIVPH